MWMIHAVEPLLLGLPPAKLIMSLPYSASLQQAAADFRYLLNRGYPRKASLSMVGNRCGLPHPVSTIPLPRQEGVRGRAIFFRSFPNPA